MELYEDKVEVRPGKITHYTWYRTPDVAVIVPFIDKSTLVMIRQYRHPLRKVLLEFPAGHVENNEDPKNDVLLFEELALFSCSITSLRTITVLNPSVFLFVAITFSMISFIIFVTLR